MSVRISSTADVHASATVGDSSTVWELAQVREHARIGRECVLGRGVYVGPSVVVGDRCKLQNYALVYEPAALESGVFIGPAAVLTNDSHPRAVTAAGDLKTSEDWVPVGVTVREGASVGAGAVCVAPVTIGRWSLVAAGAVVVRDVPDFALVMGTPARRVGWVGRAGRPLVEKEPGMWRCPVSGSTYHEDDGLLLEEEQ